jgi:hypothetical protein
MPLAPGVRLGANEVLGLIGAGGTGGVYRARDTRLGREVAVKVLPADIAAGPEHQAVVREVFRNLVTALGTRVVVDLKELLSAYRERAAYFPCGGRAPAPGLHERDPPASGRGVPGDRAVLGADRAREGATPLVSPVPASPLAWFLPLAAALLALLAAPAARAQDVAFLPDAALHLEGARYAPSEVELDWTTWIGAGLGLVSVRGATAYFAGDMETILGHERKQFDADQVNYHLEGGIRFPVGSSLLVPFLHHVSRHLIDRPKTPNVDWNLVGLRLVGDLPDAFPLPTRYAVGVGHTVETAYVAYEWELTARIEAKVWRWSRGEAYLRIAARAVTTKSTPALPRDAFLDFAAEGGMRVARGGRHLDVFVAYEHRNDVYVLNPGFRDRTLFGLRLASSPEAYLDPVWP